MESNFEWKADENGKLSKVKVENQNIDTISLGEGLAAKIGVDNIFEYAEKDKQKWLSELQKVMIHRSNYSNQKEHTIILGEGALERFNKAMQDAYNSGSFVQNSHL